MIRAWSGWLGRVGYEEGLRLQREWLEARRSARVPDSLLLLEHPPVVTMGKTAKSENLRLGPAEYAARGIEVFGTDRGGDVTYHGPGQLVGYPVFDLAAHRKDVKWYLERVEEALIDSLSLLGLRGHREEGRTGVWIEDRKIASIGVRVERWVTRHGFALNVETDLQAFDWIVPCGIRDRGITSVRRELGRAPSLAETAEAVSGSFGRVFGMDFQHETQAATSILETLLARGVGGG